MADRTGIEWCDATWNPTVGCSIVSPGCANCYAMRTAHRQAGGEKYRGLTRVVNGNPVWTGAVRLHEAALDQPLRWRRPRRIFVNSMSDLFHEDLPDAAIDRMFAVMALCPQHIFQVLTKRADRMRVYLTFSRDVPQEWRWRVCQVIDDMIPLRTPASIAAKEAVAYKPPLPNVWLGISIEDQARADERIPHLLATPAAVRFVSCEPLLRPVDLRNIRPKDRYELDALTGYDFDQGLVGERLDWVIVGGESGPGARPMHPDWARSLRDQCQAAGVPFFFKQWGEWAPIPPREDIPGRPQMIRAGDCFIAPSGDHDTVDIDLSSRLEPETPMRRVGKARAGRLLDGREWNEFPCGGGVTSSMPAFHAGGAGADPAPRST